VESVEKMWNSKFSCEGYMYGKEPNQFLKQEIDKFKTPAKILFLGEGEGRNAVYAALNGHDATALDISSIGLKKAKKLAEEFNVDIKIVHTDIEKWQPLEKYDVVMSSYLHLNEPLRTKAFNKAMDVLEDSGLFIGEFFSKEQLSRSSGGPKSLDLLYSIESLQTIFQPFDITSKSSI